MNKRIKKKWLAALRGDEYKQATGQLRVCDGNGDVTGYCCLGVLGDLWAQETGGEWDASKCVLGSDHGNLPLAVAEWAGLDARNDWDDPVIERPYVRDPRQRECPLSEMNDALGMSFKQIANVIEKYL